MDYAIARDSNARDLLLPMTSRGRFVKVGRAPPQGEQLEAGVAYRMTDLVTSLTFPCYVRLVHGKSPSVASPTFGGLLRLDEAFREETVIACALGSPKFNLVEFPLESDIHFRPATNSEHLLRSAHLQAALSFCLDHVFAYIVSLKVIQNFYTEEDDETRHSQTQNDVTDFDPVTSSAVLSFIESESIVGQGQAQAEVTDTETIRSNDTTSHYETIPFDRKRDVIEAEAPATRTSIPDDTYLLPVQQALYSNVDDVTAAASRLPRRLSMRSEAASERTLLGRLPPSGDERMNKFLKDSIEELNRARAPPAGNDVTMERNHATVQDKLDAFLDSIFDCETMETHDDVTCSLDVSQQADSRHVTSSQRPPLLRSLSDIHVKTQPMSLYISSAKSDQAPAAMTHEALSVAARDVTSDVNDSGSSSRSVSEIYRQMKLVGDAGETPTRASPYPRTDSGIVMATRHHALSSSSSQTLYPALSDASWRPPDVIDTLSVEEVTLSLLYIGLKRESAQLFAEQQIDGHQLQELDEQLLAAGFPQLNALERKKVLDFRSGWRPKKLEF